MKRTPLHRHTELQRRSFLRAVNPERKAKRREAGEVYGPGYVWIAQQPCILRGHPLHRCAWSKDRRPEAHHHPTVGAGGKDANGCTPMCHAAHDMAHSMGPETFQRRYGVDLDQLARTWWARYEAVRDEAA